MKPTVVRRPETTARGRLVVANAVIEKIAAQAALDVDAVGGLGRRHPGRRRRPAVDERPPRVSARVGRGTARISMSLSVRYPVRIIEVCEGVRTRVNQQVADLAGLRVTHIDIDVSAFESGTDPDTRVR
ncbi:Asp23/Gls24 family envelope stress response protein [Frankia sp. Cr2]|uniref:Asp23/Gls24 family envelope stress response protein n=1 Tax=Frankia sp. Cr2 TaxID=3073932 RepID=UPI002AD47E4C|nr:Asp23/Gls24 family envelope stress response protein [Frankia sp. Cr2]